MPRSGWRQKAGPRFDDRTPNFTLELLVVCLVPICEIASRGAHFPRKNRLDSCGSPSDAKEKVNNMLRSLPLNA